MLEFENIRSMLLHINHASILIRHGDDYLLCDPWFISPAFNNWTQYPGPPADLIRFILGLDKKKLSIIISHGHDDHIDDYFIQHHLAECRFFVPDFKSPGLLNRIEKITGHAPTPLTDEPLDTQPFRLSRIINEDFTGFDAIVNIETNCFTVIHANDNWHVQPQQVIDAILTIKARSPGPFYYFTQLGIADCFPQCYPQFSSEELHEMVISRLEFSIRAAEANIATLGLKQIYSYANQSRIISEFAKGPFSGFDLVSQLICNSDGNAIKSTEITQLFPGDYMNLEEPPRPPNKLNGLSKEDLLSMCLHRLEEELNAYIKDIEIPGPVSFRIVNEFDANTAALKGVIYATNRINWQRILTGFITLESISIGGGGIIIKHPREFNIRELHNSLGKFGYIAQNNFNKFGLGWLLEKINADVLSP